MRFVVETWAPEYGSPAAGAELDGAAPPIDATIEVPTAAWAPRTPAAVDTVGAPVLFVDGVRRVDARVWLADGAGPHHPGLCATVAAGVVRSEGGVARVVDVAVVRGLFTAWTGASDIVTAHGTWQVHLAPDEALDRLIIAVQDRMAELEVRVSSRAGGAALVLLDGPLRGRHDVPGGVGVVKTHRVSYLPPALATVIGELAPGQRTPLFHVQGAFPRLSWYACLPGPRPHPLAAVVRCEIAPHQALADAVACADLVTATLPRYASAAHKDPRAPQNLVPIGGLERELRRRLGDPALLDRALRVVAGPARTGA